MAGGVQQMVDRLAARLDRPVLVEDSMQRVVAYSEQNGPIDELRRTSILRRRVSGEVREWARGAGVFTAAGPVRTPAAPHLGFLPRVCVPAHSGDHLMGFLWFIDPEGSMTDEEIGIAAQAAAGVGLALFHESLVAELSAQRELEAVAGLLADEPAAAGVLLDAGCFPRSSPVTAFVMSPSGPDPDGAALERGLLLLRRRLGGRAPLHALQSGHGVLLSPDGRLRAGDLLTAFEFPVVVGAGRPRPRLALAAESYAEARQAAEIALRVPSLGPTAEWSRLGVYRLLTRLSPDAALDAHPGLEPLLDGAATLAYTLEVYLDLAGNTHAAADRLRLHRTTLYHRLHRIERLTGADLTDGEERLALHLGLKQARLTGRYRPPS